VEQPRKTRRVGALNDGAGFYLQARLRCQSYSMRCSADSLCAGLDALVTNSDALSAAVARATVPRTSDARRCGALYAITSRLERGAAGRDG
jgi:hypothetical protein